MKRLFLSVLLLQMLAGCAIVTAERWPVHGAGGMAEWQRTDDQAIFDMQARLDAALQRGATRSAAAEYEEATQLMVRTRREYAGGLHEDVQATFARLERQVIAIERKLAGAGRAGNGRPS